MATDLVLDSLDTDILVLGAGGASAALAASVFHFGDIRIPQAKARLRDLGIEVRL